MTKAMKFRLALIAIVCAAAFRDSWGHIVKVALWAGNGTGEAFTYPIAIDGVILVSAVTLAARVGVSKTTKSWAIFGRYFGFAATLFANGAAAQSANIGSILINVIPGIALIATVEMLIHASQGTVATRARSTRPARKPVAKKAASVTPIRKTKTA
jgi:Protein of unknown function (DUF2637)